MKISFSRICQGFCLPLSVFFSCITAQLAVAENKGTVPWAERAQVLNGEILDYVNSRTDPAGKHIFLLDTILVVYLGFSDKEIEEISRDFVQIPEHNFLHLDYFSFEYIEVIKKIKEYRNSHSIFVFNLDDSEDLEVLDGANSNIEISEALKSAQKRKQTIISAVYRFNMGEGDSDKVYVELGEPMEKLEKAELHFRERLIDGTCSGAIEFVDDKETRSQVNVLAVFSSAAPASEEQIDCLNRQTLVFVRPESIPFK